MKMIFEYYDSIVMSLETAFGTWQFKASALVRFILHAALLINFLSLTRTLSLLFEKHIEKPACH